MLGEKIKELRENKNLTQKELADALNVSRQAVSLWEIDRADPDLTNIKAIVKFFNISSDFLLDISSSDEN